MALFFLDYIADSVASRLVNIAVLIAMLGPLFHCMYIIQSQLDVHYNYAPFIYMSAWFILPSIVCLFILVPLQIGNNSFNKTEPLSTIISIIWCLSLFGYEVYASYVLVHFSNIAWFYFICLLASVFASIVATFCYIYMLLTKSSYITYSQEIAEQYEDIITNPSDTDEFDGNQTILQKRNIYHGYFFLLRDFVYPAIPPQKDNYTIYYPSRVVVTIFLSVCGVIGCNEVLLYFYIWSGQQLDILDGYIDTLESVDFVAKENFEVEQVKAAQDWTIAMSKTIYLFCKPISDALLFGGIVGLIFGLFGSLVIARSWRQRIAYMRHGYNISGKKLSQYDINDYPLWWSSKFISSIACCIVFGSVSISVLCAVIFGLISSTDIQSLLVENGVWKYILCYFLYYILEMFIFQYLIIKLWFKKQMDNKYCSLIMIINDFTYIPLAALFCLIRMVQNIIIFSLSFIRPDLSIFPQYLSSLDHGHLSFVSSIRLFVEKEKKYYSLQTIVEETMADSTN